MSEQNSIGGKRPVSWYSLVKALPYSWIPILVAEAESHLIHQRYAQMKTVHGPPL